MPFVLLAVGILFVVVAVKGTQGDFYALLKSEFVGSNSFIPWIAAIVVLGLAGYIKPIRPVTHAFLVLVILVMILANGGKVFGQFNQAVSNPVAPSGGASPTSSSGTALTSPVASPTPSTPNLVPAAGNPQSYVSSIINETMFGTAPGGTHSGGTIGHSQMIDVFGPQES